MKKIMLLLTVFISITTISFAHSGRTDSAGGHYNSSTGEYHYHHGYSEHQHINGWWCPYEDNVSEILPKTCPACKDNVNPENGLYCFECAYRLLPETASLMQLTDGEPDKTRSEYFREVQTLEGRIENLNSQIESKQTSIRNLNDKINANNEQIRDLETNISINHVIYIAIIILLLLYIWCLKIDIKNLNN